jgi:hypothetical protein
MVLFELIIALFIFVTVGFSIVMALDSSMRAARARNEISAGVNGLRNQFVLLRSGTLAPYEKDVSADQAGVSYHISVEAEQLNDKKGQPLPGIYRATIVAKWGGLHGQERSLSELIYQP